MGKRKAKTKAPSKPTKPKLDTAFTCPFCNAGMMTFEQCIQIYTHDVYLYVCMTHCAKEGVPWPGIK